MIPTATQAIAAHVSWMRAAGLATRTLWAAERLLTQAHSHLPEGLLLAAPEELAAFLANDTWSAQTKACYRQHLQRFYRWAADQRDPWIDMDPSTGLRSPRIPRRAPRPAVDDDMRAALAMPQPWGLFATLAAYQGLRCIEMARLQRQDVTEISIRLHGKGGARLALPTHPKVWAAVRDLPAGPVVRPVGDTPERTAMWISTRTAGAFHKAGINISLHRLRHWYATHLLRAGANLRVVQELMRHASIASTQVYTQVDSDELRAALLALPTAG